MDTQITEPTKHKRRRYSASFKAMVVNTSNAPGSSVASVAQHYELNANLLHKWRKHFAKTDPPDFIRLPVLDAPSRTATDTIRIELPGGIVIHWPVSHIADSVAWLNALQP